MIVQPGITELVERLYAPEPDEATWLEGIVEVAGNAFDGHVGMHSAMTLQVSPAWEWIVDNVVADDDGATREFMMNSCALAHPLDVRRFFCMGPVVRSVSLSRAWRSAELRSAHDEFFARLGAVGHVGALGADSDGHLCVVGWSSAKESLLPTTRATLGRIAGHLTAAYRLRRRTSSPPAAWLRPDGMMLDATSPNAVTYREQLQQAALRIDRAKRNARTEPDAALAQWKAMVEGRWTLVDRVESDGRHILVARENEPATRQHRALSDNERKIIALAALGRPSKLIAYELGLAESTISQALHGALRKLGVKNRAQLVELHGALAVGDEEPPNAALSGS